MTTTQRPAAPVTVRHRYRRRRARLRQSTAPLREGWHETKEAYAGSTAALRNAYRRAPAWLRFLLVALPLIFVIALPQLPFVSAFYKTVLVDRVLFYVLLALGLNVVVGFAGLLDLGYVAFYAIGAYLAAYLTGVAPVQPPVVLDPFLTFPFVIVVTMLVGVLLGLPTLRLRGDYLAIVTLGFHEIVRISLNNADPITNGARGLPAIPHFEMPFLEGVDYTVMLVVLGALTVLLGVLLARRGGPDVRTFGYMVAGLGGVLAALSPVLAGPLSSFGQRFVDFSLDPIPYYYLTLAVCALMIFIVQRLSNSRIGRGWVAVREDEIAAEAMGVPTLKLKIWAFAIGASTAGFAGVLLAIKTSFISPMNFILLQSIIVLSMVVFGGMGSILGSIVGAVFIGLTTEALRDLDVVPFGPIFVGLGVVLLGLGLLIALQVLRPRAGRPFGYWLLGIGGVLALASPVLRIPFLKIAETPDDFRLFLLGLILVAVMVTRPEGIIPSRRRAAELHGETTAEEETLAEGKADEIAMAGEEDPA